MGTPGTLILCFQQQSQTHVSFRCFGNCFSDLETLGCPKLGSDVGGGIENTETVGTGTTCAMWLWVNPCMDLGAIHLETSSGAKIPSENLEAFSVMPGPEERAQAAHIPATRPWRWAAHVWMLSHFCRSHSTVTHSAKHLPLGLPAQVEELWYVREGTRTCQVCPCAW